MSNSTRLLSSLQNVTGRSPRKNDEDSSHSHSNPNVNEEYLKAFRTKSYVEICKKAQRQLRKTSTRSGGLCSSTSSASSSSSSSVSLPLIMHLTDYLLEPRQEIIANIAESSKVHHLVMDYFEATLEACQCCDTILEGIHQMRLAYGRLTNIIKLSKRVIDNTNFDDDQTHKDICRELASFALQKNPLSIVSPTKFRDTHDKYMVLLQSLKSKRGKIGRILKIKRVCKKFGGIGIVASYSALVVALLFFAFHSVVGLIAAPCVMGGLFGFMRKRFKLGHHERLSTRSYSSRRLYEQIDVAAKGVYILINDLDTMSRMVSRLHNEVEHRREVAGICVNNGKGEILKQVVMEFRDYESNFLDQLEELEEHVYLCFLTINRSRRLVMQEIAEEHL